MIALETIQLAKEFRGRRALNGLDLRVPRGEIYGFIGRNGSGKSTTMKIIAGLMPATSGEIRVFGEAQAACDPNGRVGSLIEGPGLYPNLSAFDNMMVKALALGVVDPRGECRRLLRTVELADTGKMKAKKFSLGMKQRLGIALALLGSPDILMLDEPLNGLDPESARAMRGLIVRLNRERGVTVLISSHVLDQLERICTRYGVLRDGMMARELTAEEAERACTSALELSCSDAARALAIISERIPGIAATMLPGDTIRLDGAATGAQVGELLMSEGIAVFDLHRTEGDLESLFIELMGGSDTTDADGSVQPASTRSGRAGRSAATRSDRSGR